MKNANLRRSPAAIAGSLAGLLAAMPMAKATEPTRRPDVTSDVIIYDSPAMLTPTSKIHIDRRIDDCGKAISALVAQGQIHLNSGQFLAGRCATHHEYVGITVINEQVCARYQGVMECLAKNGDAKAQWLQAFAAAKQMVAKLAHPPIPKAPGLIRVEYRL